MVAVTQTMNTMYGLYFQEACKKAGRQKKPLAKHERKPTFYLGAPVGPRKRPLTPVNRILRVQGKVKANKGSDCFYPEIKLCGLWLKDIGFNEGQMVQVVTSHEKLVIEIIPP